MISPVSLSLAFPFVFDSKYSTAGFVFSLVYLLVFNSKRNSTYEGLPSAIPKTTCGLKIFFTPRRRAERVAYPPPSKGFPLKHFKPTWRYNVKNSDRVYFEFIGCFEFHE